MTEPPSVSGTVTYLKSERKPPLCTIAGVRASKCQPAGKAVEDDVVEHHDDREFSTAFSGTGFGLVHAASGAGKTCIAVSASWGANENVNYHCQCH